MDSREMTAIGRGMLYPTRQEAEESPMYLAYVAWLDACGYEWRIQSRHYDNLPDNMAMPSMDDDPKRPTEIWYELYAHLPNSVRAPKWESVRRGLASGRSPLLIAMAAVVADDRSRAKDAAATWEASDRFLELLADLPAIIAETPLTIMGGSRLLDVMYDAGGRWREISDYITAAPHRREREYFFLEAFKATTDAAIADGIYFLSPEGSAWIAVQYREGRRIGQTEESLADTHKAAGDAWAGVLPDEADVEMDGDTSTAIIRAAMPDADPEMVVVTKKSG